MTSIPQEKGSGFLKQYEAKLKTFFDPKGVTPSEFDFYYGPNDFRLLKRVEKQCEFDKDLEMERLVYLGWHGHLSPNNRFTYYNALKRCFLLRINKFKSVFPYVNQP